MHIQLQQIDERNIQECLACKVSPEQECFIASNADSLREAAEEENRAVARPFAICADGKVVGFAMFAFDEQNEEPKARYWLWRFMIDASLQGRGYGRAALQEIIRYFREQGVKEVTLSTKAENDRALGLYHAAGFRENGEKNEEEIVLKLYL